MAVPNTFASDTSSIPLADLDANFAYYDAAYSITGTTVTYNGNVGIGTSSPSNAKLDIASGNINLSDTYILAWGGSTARPNIEGSKASSYLKFSTGGGTTHMMIDSSGNMGLGVTGTIGGNTWKFGSVFTSLGIGLACTNSSGNMVNFYTSTSTYSGAITSNGSVTLYTSASDYRLKENITPMTGALAKVAQLKPCRYKWKSDGSDGQGFIAHEIFEVMPDCVSGVKDAVDAKGNPQYQGIDTSFLVATLTAAIQEQQALITTLTARITALEAK